MSHFKKNIVAQIKILLTLFIRLDLTLEMTVKCRDIFEEFCYPMCRPDGMKVRRMTKKLVE